MELEVGLFVLICFMVSKLVVNVNLNFMYPYAPFLANEENFALSADEYGVVLMAGEVGGVILVFITPWMDALSTSAIRRRICLAQICAGVTAILMSMLPSGQFLALVMLRFIFGFAFAVLVTDTAAFVGEYVPEERRGRAMSFIEFSWALGDLLQLLLGELMQDGGSLPKLSPSVIFLVIGLLSILLGIAIAVVVPQAPDVDWQRKPCCAGYGQLARSRGSSLFLLWLFIICVVYSLFHTCYGTWLKEDYNADEGMVGCIFIYTAVAEVFASMITGYLIDSTSAGASQAVGHTCWLLSTIFMAFGRMLPYHGAAVLVFALYISAELSYVVSWSLAADLAPNDQLTMFAAYGAVQGVGRTVGAGLANPVWKYGSLPFLAALSIGLMIVAGGALALAIRKATGLVQSSVTITPLIKDDTRTGTAEC